MLLPDKYLPLEDSYLGLGAVVLRNMRQPAKVDQLWKKLRRNEHFGTYDRYIVTLGLLFRGGIIELDDTGYYLRRVHD